MYRVPIEGQKESTALTCLLLDAEMMPSLGFILLML